MSDTQTQTSERLLCEGCSRGTSVDDLFSWMPLCEKHRAELQVLVANRALGKVLPPNLNAAMPSDVPQSISTALPADGKGFYLHGAVGTGKSHTAAALMKCWYKQILDTGAYPSVFWLNMPAAIIETLNNMGAAKQANSVWTLAEKSDLLTIDDIGIETPKDWIRLRLYTIVDYRITNGLPTIYTSNLSLMKLAVKIESEPIADRIAASTTAVDFSNMPNKRLV